jgi:hypothetical protein
LVELPLLPRPIIFFGVDRQQNHSSGHSATNEAEHGSGPGQASRLASQSNQIQDQGQGAEESGGQKGKQRQPETEEAPRIPATSRNGRDIKSNVNRLTAMPVLKGDVKRHLPFS